VTGTGRGAEEVLAQSADGQASGAVQDALGHADPRTTRRYDRSRHTLDRSPNYLLAAALTDS
jgi:integrase